MFESFKVRIDNFQQKYAELLISDIGFPKLLYHNKDQSKNVSEIILEVLNKYVVYTYSDMSLL